MSTRNWLERTLSDVSLSSIAASPYWGIKNSEEKEDGVSPFVAFCFTINYIVGTGFLTVPWAFVQGGLVFSTIVLVVVGVISDMAKCYTLETMARAEAMLDDRMHWVKKKKIGGKRSSEEEKENEKQPLMVYSPIVCARNDAPSKVESEQGRSRTDQIESYHSIEGSTALLFPISQKQQLAPFSSLPTTTLPGIVHSSSQPGTPKPPDRRRLLMLRRQTKQKQSEEYLIKSRKFEINTLCRVYLGKSALRIYTAMLCIYLYCTLWAYTSVFGSALARMVPIPGVEDSYLVYATIFALIVIPASCMELSEQVFVQVTMTIARFAMLFLMIGTYQMLDFEEDRTFKDEGPSSVPMFRPSGISRMIPVMVFAHLYHASIPGLALPVADKKTLPAVFRSTTIFCTVAYSLVGCILGSALGENIEESSNLNWEGLVTSSSWWLRAISRYVVLFPALDVVSAFPLNTITLGNNMLAAFYGKRIHEVENDWWIRTRFRLLASVPPIVLGILERKLGTITDYAGTVGFVIGFSFPAILYIRSMVLARKKHFSVFTYYTSYASVNTFAWLVFAFGVIMMLFVSIF